MEKLIEIHKRNWSTPSDINEHLQTLFDLARECTTALELSCQGTNSLYSLAAGLACSLSAASTSQPLKLYYINPNQFDHGNFCQWCALAGVSLRFFSESSIKFDAKKIEELDLLFIDSVHSYFHVLSELRTFAPITKKYIVMHDTTIDAHLSELKRMHMNVKEYVDKYGCKRWEAERGMESAIDLFLKENPEWRVKMKKDNNNGLTVLERNAEAATSSGL